MKNPSVSQSYHEVSLVGVVPRVCHDHQRHQMEYNEPSCLLHFYQRLYTSPPDEEPMSDASLERTGDPRWSCHRVLPLLSVPWYFFVWTSLLILGPWSGDNLGLGSVEDSGSNLTVIQSSGHWVDSTTGPLTM